MRICGSEKNRLLKLSHYNCNDFWHATYFKTNSNTNILVCLFLITTEKFWISVFIKRSLIHAKSYDIITWIFRYYVFYVRVYELNTDGFTSSDPFLFLNVINYFAHRPFTVLEVCPCISIHYWKHWWILANVTCFRSFHFITTKSEILRFSVFPFPPNKRENTVGQNMICAFVLLKFLKRNRLFDCQNWKIIYVLYYFRL